jgi:isocitrate dehydrogenase kinase/phosphatase
MNPPAHRSQAHARLILDAFSRYLEAFARISSEAMTCFQKKDWAGIQALQRRRAHQYTPAVTQCVNQLVRHPEPLGKDLKAWRTVKAEFETLSAGNHAEEVAQTFFNSVVRQIYPGLGADPEAMFVLAPEAGEGFPAELISGWQVEGSLETVFREMLRSCGLEDRFENMDRDVRCLTARFQEELPQWAADPGLRIEVIREPFFRNRACYLIGRAIGKDGIRPCLIPLLHEENGVFADSLITHEDEMTTVFSVTRAYFLTRAQCPGALVRFLRSAIPAKPESDLYDSLGYNKHGKTALYRDFARHLAQSDDQFTFAPGTPGLVMLVFTLPSYPLVFKVIKEKSDPPKTTDPARVRSQYRLVTLIERAGRLADTHEFENFSFPLHRISPELLAALQERAPNLIDIQGDTLKIRHLYTERRMIPLNLYVETCTPEELGEVAEEYALCIRELAGANIFTGDMLLKNFGVTRLKRVIFYDYDEMGLITEYRFRKLPPRTTMEDIYQAGPWFGVNPGDVFPEEFRHFLVGHAQFRQVIEERHADLFDVAFWEGMQQKIRKGEWIDMFPYERKKRFQDTNG